MPQLTDEQRQEVNKALKYIKRMEDMIHTSPDEEQKNRIERDMISYKKQLDKIMPGFNATNKNSQKIIEELSLNSENQKPDSIEKEIKKPGRIGEGILSTLKVKRASPYCNDAEVNFLFTILHMVEKGYWLALSDSYCNMDFSLSAKRDALHLKLDNALRTFKSLMQIFEEHAIESENSEQFKFSDDFSGVKSRTVIILMREINEFMTAMYDFLSKVLEKSKTKGNILQNANEVIVLTSIHKEVPVVDGKTVRQALVEFCNVCSETISYLSIPQKKLAK